MKVSRVDVRRSKGDVSIVIVAESGELAVTVCPLVALALGSKLIDKGCRDGNESSD